MTPRHIYASTLTRRQRSWGRRRTRAGVLAARGILMALVAGLAVLVAARLLL